METRPISRDQDEPEHPVWDKPIMDALDRGMIAFARQKAMDECSGGVCTTIDNLCSRHQMQYQDKWGRASNE